jgi:hypothetical protein
MEFTQRAAVIVIASSTRVLDPEGVRRTTDVLDRRGRCWAVVPEGGHNDHLYRAVV